MNLLKIAWRNLWRNKRRTAITAASILFAVFFAIIMRSYQLGFYGHMIKSAIESYAGFLQVQNPDYQDDPSLENNFECSDSLLQVLDKTPGLKAVVPRIETFALASSGNQTKGVLIIGIDPERESMLANPAKNIVKYRLTKPVINSLKSNKDIPENIKQQLESSLNYSFANIGSIASHFELDPLLNKNVVDEIASASAFHGNYISVGKKSVLVSDKLSKYLKINVGDTLVLMGQGFHGSTAADLFEVAGIVKIPHPELDNKLVYMPLDKAQAFLDIENRVTSLAINLTDNRDENMLIMQDKLNSMFDQKQLTVKNWKEFNKVLMQQIESDNQSGKVFLALLYFIIFFGIFGTVLMMIHERKRELGVLVSIGMRKTKLGIIIIIEMFFMGLIGVLSGLALSSPLIWYLFKNPMRLTGDMAQVMEDMGFEPVMPLAWFDMYMVWQGLIVALMVVLASIYPLRKVFKLKEIEALRA